MKPILGQLFKNDTIDILQFPIFQTLRRQNNPDNHREITFFLNSHFNFENKIWKSGLFKIHDEDWKISETNEHKFPILGWFQSFPQQKFS